jgi:arylsulfatase
LTLRSDASGQKQEQTVSSFRNLLCLSLLLASGHALAQAERPNILLLVADDLGYTDLGAFGGEIPTPTLDELAYAGVRLTNFHTGQACQQTRAMLMTGRGASSVMQANPPRSDGERANEMRKDVATLPELLSDAGYRTYMAGKWDLGLTSDVSPLARGFDRSFSLIEASSSHFAEYFWEEASYYQEDDRRILLEDLPEDFYSTTAYTDKMLEYLQEHDDAAPWFGYMAYTAPHWPLQVPDAWLNRHAGTYDDGYDVLRTQRARRAAERGVIPAGASLEDFDPTAAPWNSLSSDVQERYVRSQEIYASMVELLDQEIGRLIAHLEDTDQLDNTIIFFMSDHGASAAEIGILDDPSSMAPHFNTLIARRDNSMENFGRPGSFVDHGRGFGEAATAPLRYYKGTLGEGGIRAAAFVRYPDQIAERTINSTFATVMDLLPTFLDIAGTSHPGATRYRGRQIQSVRGRSVWPNLTGESSTVHGSDNGAGWSGRGPAIGGPIGAIIKGRYKLTNQPSPVERSASAPAWQLYDLEADPGETRDLAPTNPRLVDSLAQEWRENWR